LAAAAVVQTNVWQSSDTLAQLFTYIN